MSLKNKRVTILNYLAKKKNKNLYKIEQKIFFISLPESYSKQILK